MKNSCNVDIFLIFLMKKSTLFLKNEFVFYFFINKRSQKRKRKIVLYQSTYTRYVDAGFKGKKRKCQTTHQLMVFET